MSPLSFVGAQHFSSQDGPGFLAVYKTDDINVLSRESSKVVKSDRSNETVWMLANVKGFTRDLAFKASVKPVDHGEADRALDAPLSYALAFNILPEAHAEFDA